MNLKVILSFLCVTGGLTDPILAQPPRTKQAQQSRQPQPGKQPQQYPRLRNYQRAPLFEWTIPVYPFTEEANYMSIFGYVRHRYFLSPDAPPPTPTRDAFSVAGTSW